jgi:division protein CdvB (Snf7/Vps24/ESCRT-III family)
MSADRETMRSNQSMTDAMKGVTKAMRSMNKHIKLPEIQKIVMDFERESDMMDMKEEMMNDAMDDVMDEGNEEEESDQIVNQVLDEIGISFNQQVTLKYNKWSVGRCPNQQCGCRRTHINGGFRVTSETQ